MGHRSCRWIARILGIALGAALAAGVTLSPAPPPAHAALEGAAQLETHRIRQGDTLFELLVAAGASPDDADSVGRAVARVSNPRRIPAGREIRFLFEPGESERRTLFAVSVEFGPDRFVEVIRDAQGAYRARLASVPLKHAAALMAGSPANDMVEMRAAQNETIGGILLRQGLPARAVDAAVKALRTHFDPRTLMPGQRLSIRSTSDSEGELELGGFAVHLKGGDEVVAVLPAEGGGFVSRRMSHTAFHAIGEEREPAREAQPVPSTAVEEAPGPAAAAPPDPVPDPVAEADTGLAEERITLRQERTLTNLLLSSGVERAEAAPAARSLRRVFDRRTLPVGTAVDIARQAPEGATPRLVELRIALQDGRIIEIERRRKGRFESRIADAPAAPAIAALPVADAEPDEPKDAPAPTLAASSEAPPEPEPASPLAKTRIEIRAGDTLMAVLREQGIDRLEADRAIRAARKRLNLKRLGIGQEIILWTDADETGAAFLQGLAIRTSGERYVRVIRASATSFEARHVAAADLRAPEVAVTATPPQIAQRPTGTDDTPASPPEPAAREVEAAAVRGNGPGGLVYKEVVLGRGDTLFASLKRAGGSDEESEAVVAAFRKIHDPRRLQIGQTLSLLFESGPEDSLKVARLALNVAPDQNVVVVRDGDSGFLSRSEERTLHRVVRRASGAIQTSLYEAAVAAGVPVQVLTEVIHILSFDVDFQREIQRGNRFDLLFSEAYDRTGDAVDNGPVHYLAIEAGHRRVELFRYEPEDGPADYVDSNGESVRKALMRTPINGARLSSAYGMRKHPILGYNRKHLGIDFAAPTGTPIFAAGDGTIKRIGRNGGYGKHVQIRHNGIYTTLYAHLSRYANGMKTGRHVRQGQIIGYVGSTGRSTGPHLHYEVIENGTRINPATLKLPSGRKLEGEALAAFQESVRETRTLLARLPGETLLARQ